MRNAFDPNSDARQAVISGCEMRSGKLYISLTVQAAMPETIEDLRELLAATDAEAETVGRHLGLHRAGDVYDDEVMDPAPSREDLQAALDTIQSYLSN